MTILIQVLHCLCYDLNTINTITTSNSGIMSARTATMAYLSIASGYAMGLALVHAGTGNKGVKNIVCSLLTMLLRLRGGRLSKIQKQTSTACSSSSSIPHYSTPFIKACGDKNSRALVEMTLSCLVLAGGIVMSGTGVRFYIVYTILS